MNNYLELLQHSFQARQEWECPPRTHLEYMASAIFDFTTYDSETDELFAQKAVEVCRAISARETFEYIKDQENYRWFLIMVNMPFFVGRLEWGTSIRGAWWDTKPQRLTTCELWNGDDQVLEMTFTPEQWTTFIAALVEFASAHHGQPKD